MTNIYASALVVKYGGNAMAGALTEADPILTEVRSLRQSGHAIVIVHGGGPEIDAALAQRGIVTQRVDGMRVTDAATLETTEAVLCGSVNKRIVRQCLALGLPAVGISGEDGGMLVAERLRPPNRADLGYVGSIARTDIRLIQTLLAADFVPIVAPLAVTADALHAYNVNADLAAGAIAVALKANALILVTNVPRVLRDPDDPGSGIGHFTPEEALCFAAGEACRSSMKPKLQAAANAANAGVTATYICAFKQNAVASAMSGDATLVSKKCAALPEPF